MPIIRCGGPQTVQIYIYLFCYCKLYKLFPQIMSNVLIVSNVIDITFRFAV